MKKILGCKQLTDSMAAGDKQRVLATLIECAMTDIQLVRFIPGMEKVGLAPVIDEKQETEFREKLRKVCTTWQKQK